MLSRETRDKWRWRAFFGIYLFAFLAQDSFLFFPIKAMQVLGIMCVSCLIAVGVLTGDDFPGCRPRGLGAESIR
jgi:hypothetical protein